MALFGGKQKTEKKAASPRRVAPVKPQTKNVGMRDARNYRSVVRPHVTEKSIVLSEHRTYTFEVFPYANKKQIAEFVRAYYGVTPTAVRIARKGIQEKFIRGRWGIKAGMKKAYVTLKEGDKIDFA